MNTVFFNYRYSNSRLEFKIDGDDDFIKRQVIRSEGKRCMTLKQKTLYIELDEDPKLCNDHLGLIFILAFHPILECNETVSVIFPFTVSQTFLDAIKINWILPNIEINSEIDDNLSIYKLEGVTILYGGGLDSFAIKLLMQDFPGIRLVNQINECDEICAGSGVDYIKTNIRDLYSVYGLPLWVSIMIVGIINKSKYLMSGGQLTSSYLFDGLQYKDRTKNLWLSVVMKNLGIHNCNFPFLSEVSNTEIVFKHKELEKAMFCTFTNNKEGKCTKCTKCLRKFMLMACYDHKYIKQIEMFDLSHDTFTTFFSRKTLYFADIFLFCVKKLLPYNSKNIGIIHEYLKQYDISDSSFLSRYYKTPLDEYDEEIKGYLIQKLHSLDIKPMNENDIHSMINYKHSKRSNHN